METVLRDHDHHTYGEYLTWPEDLRYELIDGKAYSMAPAPSLIHQEIVGEIHRQLANQLEGKSCRPFVAPVDVRLPKGNEADERIDTVVQPDVMVVCDESKLDRRGVRGAPDFAVEVLSPASAFHDHQRKRTIYERAGVREYWLVDPAARIITIYHLENGVFGKPDIQPMGGDTPARVILGVRIQWEGLVERLPEIDRP